MNNSSMLSKVKILFGVLATGFIFYCIYLSSLLVQGGDVHMSNDIGRDFLLLQELDQKKIVLIGPRSNTAGVFHGPLWTYMNYPAYLLGHGNPVTVAWFWVILGAVFLVTTFFIGKKLFGVVPSFLVTALLAVDMAPHINSVFSPEALFFFMPFFLFTIYEYIQKKKVIYLCLHLITVGIFIHLNIGVGLLFAMMSGLLTLVLIVRSKKWKHLFAFLILPVTVSNFFLFDVRHGFGMTKALFHVGGTGKFFIPIREWLLNRLDNMVTMQILVTPNTLFSVIIFCLVMGATIWEIKKKSKDKTFLSLLAFYFFGYILLSYFNKGINLFHYLYVMVPMSALWLGTLAKGRFKLLFIPLLLVIIYMNFQYAKGYVEVEKTAFVGKATDSWVSLKRVGDAVVKEQGGNAFGYFVYSPDAFAYQQRYAMLYSFATAKAKAYEYVKKPITYVIAAPPPVFNPYMRHEWWVKNEAKIAAEPIETHTYPGGYIVEKFALDSQAQQVPYDPNIELGIHFR